ncbi:MAG: mechanosensitive ion channel [Proteobacteria bacterium]|nr:mechanosensitive ion channel [Pseudomonadota bacterium]
MLEATTSYLSELPDWLLPVGLALAAIAFAITIHGLLITTMRRWIGVNHPYLRSVFTNTKGATRLALIIIIVSVAVPAAPLSASVQSFFSRALVFSFIILGGWFALIATKIAADFYLRRFDVQADDNLLARKHYTQVRILQRAAETLIVIVTVGAALMTFEAVRQFGISLFASAGVAGLVVALAARPVFANLIAGVQIAMTQPIRVYDAVVVEGEWGWIEEITSAFVVIKLWDWRRLVVPLSYFIEKPFQNWTRENSSIIGSILVHADYTVPIDRVREKLKEIAKASPLWDGQVVNLQVTDATEGTIELRALVSARTSPSAWDLRCEVREKLIAFIQEELPGSLPRVRASLADGVLNRRRVSEAKGLHAS